MPLPLIIIGVVVVVVIILGVVLVSSNRPAGQELVEERLGGREIAQDPDKKKKKKESAATAAVDRAVQGRGFARNLATQLAQADLKWTVGEFLTMSFLLAVGAALLFLILGRVFFVPIGVAIGFFGPRMYLGSRKSKRLKEFNNQLGDALNLMVNSLRAGYSSMQAMEVISNEMPKPICDEFGRVVKELQLGVSFDVAMLNMVRRVPSGDMDLVVTAMSVQREVGGNLAEVLDAISFTIRERVRIKGEIQTMTAQGRITGYVVTGLPFGLGGILYLINPEFMQGLFTDPCGWIMLGISFFMIAMGYIAINKIVTIEV